MKDHIYMHREPKKEKKGYEHESIKKANVASKQASSVYIRR
jgi:hypothetical protein